MRTKTKIGLTISIFSIAMAVLVAFLGWQQAQFEADREIIDDTIGSSSKLSAKAEMVLDTVFKTLDERPNWILAQGVATLKGEDWQVTQDFGEIDQDQLSSFFKGREFFQAAYLFSSNQTLFLKQTNEFTWQWKLTQFVPRLMNITLDLDSYSMRFLTNEKFQVIGVDKKRAGELDHRFLQNLFDEPRSRQGNIGWDILEKKGERFIRSYSPVQRSNMVAVSISRLDPVALASLSTVIIRALSVLLFGGLMSLAILSLLNKNRLNVLRAISERDSSQVDKDWLPALSEIEEQGDGISAGQQAHSGDSEIGVVRNPIAGSPEMSDQRAEIDLDGELTDLVRDLTNQIKQPITALMGYLRLFRGQNLSPSLVDGVDKIEAEARQSREILDLMSMYSQAEEVNAHSVVDFASVLGQLSAKYGAEFGPDHLLIERSSSEGAFAFANETHFRRTFDLLIKSLRADHKLKLGWRLSTGDGKLILEFIDYNGSIRAEEWSQLGRPFTKLSSRPQHMTLALAAWNGSMKSYGIQPTWIRSKNGFICRYELNPISEEEYEKSRNEIRENFQAKFSETENLTENLKFNSEDLDDELGLESSDATMVISEPDLAMVKVPKKIEDIVGSELPSESLAEKRKLNIDDYVVKVRPPKSGSPN